MIPFMHFSGQPSSPSPSSFGGSAVLPALGNLASNVFNVGSQRGVNRDMMQFQERMFHLTNQYNHPKAQMQRMIEAGLNPNLMYEHGSSGQASMPSSPKLNAPEVGLDFHSGLMLQSNLENMKAERELVQQRTQNEKDRNPILLLEAIGKNLRNMKAEGTLTPDIERSFATLNKIYADTAKTNAQDEQIRTMTPELLRSAQAKTSLMGKQWEKLDLDTKIRAIDQEMYDKYGIRPQDPLYSRLLISLFGPMWNDIKEIGDHPDTKSPWDLLLKFLKIRSFGN